MVIRRFVFLIFSAALFSGACTTVQHISKTEASYNVVKSETISEDPAVSLIVEPYKKQLDAVMNEVLAVLPVEIAKGKPESPLGNWVTDVIVERLRDDGNAVDLAVVN